MTVEELIEELEKLDPNKEARILVYVDADGSHDSVEYAERVQSVIDYDNNYIYIS